MRQGGRKSSHRRRRGGLSWDSFTDAFKHGLPHLVERIHNEVTNKDSEYQKKIAPKVKLASKIARMAGVAVPEIPGVTSGGKRKGRRGTKGHSRRGRK